MLLNIGKMMGRTSPVPAAILGFTWPLRYRHTLKSGDESDLANYDLANLSFLVVDDNDHMRRLIVSLLKAMGVRRTREAEDGAHALNVLKQFDADMIIVDWNMEPVDGLEFAKRVRTSDDSPNIYVPLIMLTGHTDASKVFQARDAGVNEFLAKPVSAKKLYLRIKAIIDTPRQFIRTPTYFGPDRRRKDDPTYKGPERRDT